MFRLLTKASAGVEMGTARPLRIDYTGGNYHVINRGNYRKNLFAGLKKGEGADCQLTESPLGKGETVEEPIVS